MFWWDRMHESSAAQWDFIQKIKPDLKLHSKGVRGNNDRSCSRGNGVLVQVAPEAVKSPWSSSEATWAPCSGYHCWNHSRARGPSQPPPVCDSVGYALGNILSMDKQWKRVLESLWNPHLWKKFETQLDSTLGNLNVTLKFNLISLVVL